MADISKIRFKGVEYNIKPLMDSVPTQGSDNAVSSGGVYSALEDKADKDDTPEIVTPEETNADFYLADENGNVLMELADGHIKTKNFDSADIDIQGDVETSPQATNADTDFNITDDAGNVIAEFGYGQIKTKNFTSDNGIYTLIFDYDGSYGYKIINHSFPAGTEIALHLVSALRKGWRTAGAKIATYSYINRSGTKIRLGQEYVYNFFRATLPEDAIGIRVDYASGVTSDNKLAFSVYAIASFPKKPKIIRVATDGTKDYTSIREACDAVPVDVCEMNPYEIHVYPGTYNILEEYTAEEIAEDGFKGLILYNGMGLKGIGRRSEIVLTATLSEDDYAVAKRNDISTLNLDGNTLVENVTVEAYNIRYAIHDEGSGGTYHLNNHVVKNCKLFGKNLTSGGGGNTSYGAGSNGYKAIKLIDCDFSDQCAVHTSANLVHPIFVEYDNCSARLFRFTDSDTSDNTIVSHAFLRNCKASIIHLAQSGSHAQHLFMYAEGTCGAIVKCPSGYVYETGDTRRFNDIAISAGKAVKMANLYDSRQTNLVVTGNKNDIYGVSIGTIGDDTIIQIAGYINSAVLGLTGLAVGDYLTVDASGNVVSGGTADNAIAQVRVVDADSVAYAKLMI